MSSESLLWADPRLVYAVGVAAVVSLLATIWLFRRRRQTGRQAGVICMALSIGLHVALILLVPYVSQPKGGSTTADTQSEEMVGVDEVQFSAFDPEMTSADAASQEEEANISPLPVSDLSNLLDQPTEPTETPEPEAAVTAMMDDTQQSIDEASELVPESLSDPGELAATESLDDIDQALGDWLNATTEKQPAVEEVTQFAGDTGYVGDQPPEDAMQETPKPKVTNANAATANIPGTEVNDFANRTGKAKEEALNTTGGNENTEAAVEAALKFLASAQRPDGAWDPTSTGAGVERAPLGEDRKGAGSRAESAITGLALLTIMGAGHTHQDGEYADNVYRGLAYLIRSQRHDGSLAGNASPYSATYSHGMAALAMCEAAAISGDASAVTCAKRAIAYTTRLQHPTSGGWRYLPGDKGDLSQLGWQAMVLDAGNRARIPVDPRSVQGVRRFLRTVRAGTSGGLAGYRAGEAPSRTMTAEALATRLLIGESVPDAEVQEAEQYLLQQPPGVGQDNYYYWYYATLALHQLQDDAWDRWNKSLQTRLLSTQLGDGSWPTGSVWGGYGGTVYTTSMAALCLESYYRHEVRANQARIAELK